MQSTIRASSGLLLAGLGSFILMGAGQSLYGPALPTFARHFGIEAGSAGFVISAHWIGTGVGVGAMFRMGHRITPRLALGVMAAGAALVALSFGMIVTLAGVVLFGAGYGASTVIYNRRFMQVFGARGPSMLALLNAVFGIGAIGAPLLFVAFGGRIGLSYGVVAVACAVALLAAGRPRRLAPPAARHGTIRVRWGILAFGMAAVGAEATLIGLGPTALIAIGQSETQAAQFLSLFFAMFLAVRLLLVALSALVPAFTLFTGALVFGSICAFGAALTGEPWFFAASGAAAGMFFPLFYVTAFRLMGDDDRISPLAIGAGLVGGIIAPLLIGALMERLGNGAFFGILGAGMAATAIAAGLSLRRMNAAV